MSPKKSISGTCYKQYFLFKLSKILLCVMFEFQFVRCLGDISKKSVKWHFFGLVFKRTILRTVRKRAILRT